MRATSGESGFLKVVFLSACGFMILTVVEMVDIFLCNLVLTVDLSAML